MAYKKRRYKGTWVQGEEDIIQIEFFKLIRAYRDKYPVLNMVYAVPNGTYTNQINAEKAYALGRTSGPWDVTIDVPRGTYHGARIEFKSSTGRLSATQKKYKLYYDEYNFLAVVCRSCDEAWKFTLDYIGLLGLKNFYYGNFN